MVKIIQNEFKKFLTSKTFLFEIALIVALCLLGVVAYKDMANIAANDLPRAQSYSEDFKVILMNMNTISFAKLFLTDFIYKGYFSFFLIFIVTRTVNTFSTDRENGTMKFTLLTGIDKVTLIEGKLAFVACSIVMIVLFNILLSLIVGFLAFGGLSSFYDFIDYLIVSLLAIVPGLAMAVIIAVFSQMRISSKVIMTAGLISVFVFGLLNRMTSTNLFSPTGALAIFPDQIPTLNQGLLIRCFVSLLYCAVGLLVLRKIAKEYEYYE